MKKLIIDESHRAEIEQALADGQKRTRERTILSYDDLIAEIKVAVCGSHFPWNLPKKSWDRCVLTLRIGAAHFANSYKFAPQGTVIVIKYRQDGKGEIVSIGRDYCKDKKPYAWRITEQMRNYIMAAMNCTVICEE